MINTIHRKIVTIDAEKCNGCEACATACHEGAIIMREGKAVLLRDDYCDGLGDCLPACPTGAITIEEREALPYDEAAVVASQAIKKQTAAPQEGMTEPAPAHCGCTGGMVQEIAPTLQAPFSQTFPAHATGAGPVSCLRQWPVQMRLVPADASFLSRASLLIAADCTAFAFAAFHREFMQGKVTLIGCPKLDSVDYAEKLCSILSCNTIQDITVVKMSVPCCSEMARATMRAIEGSGREVPLKIITITTEGELQAAFAQF